MFGCELRWEKKNCPCDSPGLKIYIAFENLNDAKNNEENGQKFPENIIHTTKEEGILKYVFRYVFKCTSIALVFF